MKPFSVLGSTKKRLMMVFKPCLRRRSLAWPIVNAQPKVVMPGASLLASIQQVVVGYYEQLRSYNVQIFPLSVSHFRDT